MSPGPTASPAHRAPIAVRAATVEDASSIAEVFLRSWLAGYDGLVDPEALRPAAEARASFDWPTTLASPDRIHGVATVDEAVVGVAAVELRSLDHPPGPWLEALYVVPEAWGTGAADVLLSWAVDRARATGSSLLRLRVVEPQVRARRFYERNGWTYDPEAAPDRNAFFPLLAMRLDL